MTSFIDLQSVVSVCHDSSSFSPCCVWNWMSSWCLLSANS